MMKLTSSLHEFVARLTRQQMPSSGPSTAKKTAAAELETMRGQLSVAQSHARALKEANASAEQRATEASSARQAAEMALHEQKELVALAHKQIAQLEEQLRNERTVHERMRRDRTGF
mmetsp:Transcript_13293/g.25682  ORF Transcript_13293/g.25682 Transcript_13293/m.25682 type:complete len:117 (-) Transcript_13293:36-386(-)